MIWSYRVLFLFFIRTNLFILVMNPLASCTLNNCLGSFISSLNYKSLIWGPTLWHLNWNCWPTVGREVKFWNLLNCLMVWINKTTKVPLKRILIFVWVGCNFWVIWGAKMVFITLINWLFWPLLWCRRHFHFKSQIRGSPSKWLII